MSIQFPARDNHPWALMAPRAPGPMRYPPAMRTDTLCFNLARTLSWVAAVATALVLFSDPVLAQNRDFPADAKVGTLAMGVFPAARIDGEDRRFGAGARILDTGNRLVLPASLTQPALIAYRIDYQGLVSQAWIINPAEAAALRNRR